MNQRNTSQEKSKKRVFWIVLDSLGIGRQPDAVAFGDGGSNTLAAISTSPSFVTPHLACLGLFEIPGIKEDIQQKRSQVSTLALNKNAKDSENKIKKEDLFSIDVPKDQVMGSYARLLAKSQGKDTTIGHWEMAGLISPKALPVFPQGFPKAFITEFERQTGRKTLCNQAYSGTEVIADYGVEHVATGDLIVYTSADSVFQIAAHEAIIPIEELYRYCQIARDLLQGEELGVGRVIARPFEGEFPDFKRTFRRHDYSLAPPKPTVLDLVLEAGQEVIGVGKIYDIFAGKGVNQKILTSGNADGIDKTLTLLDTEFQGLAYINLVDFDMMYGHRNDITGYAKAVTAFDQRLPEILMKLKEDDLLVITADHGCDPSTVSTDHSRESVFALLYGKQILAGQNWGERKTFADLGKSIGHYLGLDTIELNKIDGEVFFSSN